MQNTTSEYDLVSAWAKANFTLPVAQKSFVQQATDSLRKDEDCFIAIGPKVTKGRKPWLVALFAKNLHAYRLTREQASHVGAVNAAMIHTSRPPMCNLPTMNPMPVEINRVEIDNSSRLPCNAPITGKVHFEVRQPLSAEPVAVMEYNLKGISRVISSCYPLGLPSSGEIKLDFPPIAHAEAIAAKAWTPTILAFVRLVCLPNGTNSDLRIPISNAVGVLLNVVSAS